MDSTNAHSHMVQSKDLFSKVSLSLDAFKAKVKHVKNSVGVNDVQRRRAFFVSAAEEREIVSKMHRPGSWQIRVLDVLQSSRVQLTMTALLIIDVIIVVVELFIDAEFPACSIIERDALSCCSNISSSSSYAYAPYYSQCDSPLVDSPQYPAACDPYKYKFVKKLHWVLFIISVSILTIFLIELLGLIVILRDRFLHNRLYLIDFVVVTAALSLEIFVKFVVKKNSSGDLAGVLTFARMWRFIRLGHGLVSSLHESHASHIEEMEKHFKEVAGYVGTLQARLDQLEGEALARAGGNAAKKFATNGAEQALPSKMGKLTGARKDRRFSAAYADSVIKNIKNKKGFGNRSTRAIASRPDARPTPAKV